LGAGFLEKVCERALLRELSLRGISAKAQALFPVSYKDQKDQYVGEYLAELVMEDKLIVELKCMDRFAKEDLAHSINYLKALRTSGRLIDQL
jgi:GxxExxY protein